MHKIKQLGKNIVAGLVVVMIIIAGISFYAGTKYSGGQKNINGQFSGQFNPTNGGKTLGGRNMMRGAGFITGNVLSKDATSITVSSRDGGSKIIFLSASTEVTKSVQGAIGDVVIGKPVSVNGTTNTDGSITAQSIQIRPEIPAGIPAPRQ